MMLSIVTPAYKEGEHIYANLQELIRAADDMGLPYEIIVVADGEVDDTYQQACRIESDKLHVYQYQTNQGKGFALSYGFYRSTGEVVVFIDADMDLPPHQIKDFVESVKTGAADIVIGSKRHPLSQVRYPTRRRLLSRCYQALIRALFDLRVTDTQVGLKAFRREVLETVLPRVVVKRYAFDLELLVVAQLLGFRAIKELPVELHYQFTGSGVGLRAVRHALQDTAGIFYRASLLHSYDRPLTTATRPATPGADKAA